MSCPRKRDAAELLVQHQQHQCVSPTQQRQQRTHKRACGSAAHPAPGALTPQQQAAFLHSLSAHLDSAALQAAGQVLSPDGWSAFAELNMLLSSGSLPGHLLVGYHSFVRQPRASLWGAYSSYAAQRGRQSSQQLDLLRFLLERVLAPYPDASLTEVTLSLPPWMVSWASRWGMAMNPGTGAAAGGPSITLIQIEAFAPLDPSSSRSAATSPKPVRKLFVPAAF